MGTTDDHHDRGAVETAADTAGFTSILSRPRAMVVFAFIVFVVTTLQSISDPLAGAMQGDVVWDYPIPLGVVTALVVLGCAVQSGFLLLATRLPLVAVVGTTACYLALVVGLEVPRWLGGLPPVVAVAVFFLAASRRPAVATAWSAVTIGATVGVLSLWSLSTGAPLGVTGSFVLSTGLAFAAPVVGAAALGVWWARRMRGLHRARAAVAAAAARHETELEHAKTLERARIAQELHDVAGQHLAGLLSLADAAVDIEALDAEQASALIAEMRAEGRFASASLYAALRDLRAENDARAEPTLDLRSLDELVQYWASRGMDVTREVDGAVDDLPAMVSTTAYRVVQEALTNACKHAAGAAVTVEVRVTDSSIRVVVANAEAPAPEVDATPDGLGWGVAGMAERVDLLHGTFAAGPVSSGGWAVVMEAPLSVHTAPTPVPTP